MESWDELDVSARGGIPAFPLPTQPFHACSEAAEKCSFDFIQRLRIGLIAVPLSGSEGCGLVCCSSPK